MKTSLTWLFATSLLCAVACDDGEQSLGENGECVALDARGEGQCDKGLGVVYGTDGGCIGIAGCECVGADCDQVFATYDECKDACLVGQPCTQGPETGVGYCPDNGMCRAGTCVYE